MARSSLFAPPARNYSPGDRAEMSRFATPEDAAKRPTLRRPMVTGGGGFRGGGVVRQTRANTSGADLRNLGLQRQRDARVAAAQAGAVGGGVPLRPTTAPMASARGIEQIPVMRNALKSKQLDVLNQVAGLQMDQERLGLQRQGMAFDQQATAARMAQDQRQFDAGLGLRREGMMYDDARFDQQLQADEMRDFTRTSEGRADRVAEQDEANQKREDDIREWAADYENPDQAMAYALMTEEEKAEQERIANDPNTPPEQRQKILEGLERIKSPGKKRDSEGPPLGAYRTQAELIGIINDPGASEAAIAAAQQALTGLQRQYGLGGVGAGAALNEPVATSDPAGLAAMPGEPGYTGLRRTPPAGGGMQSAVPRTREELVAQIKARGLNPDDFDLDAIFRATQGQ